VQLVRGPMVSDILGHPDERRAVASRFLRAAPALTARMLAPTLYVHNVASDTFHEVRASAMSIAPPWSVEFCSCTLPSGSILPAAPSFRARVFLRVWRMHELNAEMWREHRCLPWT
jgi:hypothetical protein